RCGEWEAAREVLEKAVRLSPDNAFVLATQADYLCEIGEYEDAAKSAGRATAIAADDAWKYGVLGWALENIGAELAEEALAAYRQAFKLAKTQGLYLKGIGNAQRTMGEKDEARKSYSDVLTLARSPQASTIKVDPALLGWCHYGLGQYDEAIRLYS